MRLLGFAFFLAVVFAVGTVVVAIDVGRGGGLWDRPREPQFHRPETAGERAAAAVGLRYARAMARDDVGAACAVAIGAASHGLGCDTARARVQPCGGTLTVYHAKVDAGGADVIVGMCTLTLQRFAGGWLVAEDRRVGYA